MNERHENFRRLAKKRANRVADELRKIGNLSSSNYKYEREEVEELFDFIKEQVEKNRKRFKTEGGVEEFQFKS